MIKSISYVHSGGLVQYRFPSAPLVRLCGTDAQCNEVLSLLERMMAQDFSTYFDRHDAQHGVGALDGIGRCVMELDVGSLSYIDGKASRRLSTKRAFHCIRYAGGAGIRSIVYPVDEGDKGLSGFGSALTAYSSALSLASWVRLARIYNELVGFEAVSFNASSRELKLNFEVESEWSRDALELMYLVLAESFVSAHRGMRIILLSQMDCFSTPVQFGKFLRALILISNIQTIVFTNEVNLPDTCDTGLCSELIL